MTSRKKLIAENLKAIEEGGELTVPLAQIPEIKKKYLYDERKRSYAKIYNKIYREDHPERLGTKEEKNEYQKEYRKKNKDKLNARQNAYRAKRKLAGYKQKRYDLINKQKRGKNENENDIRM